MGSQDQRSSLVRLRSRVRVVLVATMMISAIGAFTAEYAWAGCGGTIKWDYVGGYEGSTARYGNRARILVNNFASAQYMSWRMVWILKSSNNNAETGWQVQEALGNQDAHPFKTWVTDGVKDSYTASVSLTKGQLHEFKVHDQNGDKNWSFAYDGNPLGNHYVNMSSGTPISESERNCTSDSLYARVTSLSKINSVNGSWTPYGSLSQYVDTATDYNFCRVSNTEFYVKKTC